MEFIADYYAEHKRKNVCTYKGIMHGVVLEDLITGVQRQVEEIPKKGVIGECIPDCYASMSKQDIQFLDYVDDIIFLPNLSLRDMTRLVITNADKNGCRWLKGGRFEAEPCLLTDLECDEYGLLYYDMRYQCLSLLELLMHIMDFDTQFLDRGHLQICAGYKKLLNVIFCSGAKDYLLRLKAKRRALNVDMR